MKGKLTPTVILLCITASIFIACIFLLGIRIDQQINDTSQGLDVYISQVRDKQQELNDAQASFSNAVKNKKDILNYQQKKAAGKTAVTPEHRDTSESDSTASSSVFSQDHN